MTVVYTESVPSLGATKLAAVVTVADLEAPILATEIKAVTSVEMTGRIFADGYNPGGSQGKGSSRRRLGATTTKERLNSAQHTSPSLQYPHDPSAADDATGNEAREALQEGTVWNFVERRGPDSDDDWAEDERVRVHKLKMGKQFEMDSTDENGEFYIMQETEYVNEGPITGVVTVP